ncbi:hypothetical protein [Agromyces sp. GXQ0307]|uniref:hypothetical protein n=1 Tax=Agromyces sp. GXQ0307 TaxID=3377835 RepID=UPI00383B6711
MDIDLLEALPLADQWTFVRGRIVETSVELDAALRGLHAQLRGLDSVEALLSAPVNWTQAVDQCRTMTACAAVDESAIRAAIGKALDEAAIAYERRNRYMHDLLTADLADELLPDPTLIDKRNEYYLLRLSSKQNSATVTHVVLDDAIGTVNALVAAMWKVRAARGYLAGQTTWRTALLGELEGDWHGTATWTYGGSDDD